MLSTIMKILAALPELVSLLKKIIELIGGSENKLEAKVNVSRVHKACEGVACEPKTLKD